MGGELRAPLETGSIHLWLHTRGKRLLNGTQLMLHGAHDSKPQLPLHGAAAGSSSRVLLHCAQAADSPLASACSPPSPVRCPAVQAYVNAICANNATAGATLAAAILAGGPTSKLAAYSTLYRCDGSTLDLDRATWEYASPYTTTDADRAIR